MSQYLNQFYQILIIVFICPLLNAWNFPQLRDYVGVDEERENYKCYGEDIGCFANEWPFYSSWMFGRKGVLPQSVAEINAAYTVFTCSNEVACQDKSVFSAGYDVGWEKNATTTQFTAHVPTIFLIHGYASWADYWCANIKNELMEYYNGQVNAVLVEWKDGANQTYPQAVSNARLVARQIANIAENLVKDGIVDSSDIRLVGHSVGAQLAGYVGKEFFKSTGKKIGRIDAMEPARIDAPSSVIKTASLLFLNDAIFNRQSPEYGELQLTRNDADFVQVIHTTPGIVLLALANGIGHADFYPSSYGFYGSWLVDVYQGGCGADPACNHSRSHLYYKRSINSPQCFHTTGHESKNTMGFHAVKPGIPTAYSITVKHLSTFSSTPIQNECGI